MPKTNKRAIDSSKNQTKLIADDHETDLQDYTEKPMKKNKTQLFEELYYDTNSGDNNEKNAVDLQLKPSTSSDQTQFYDDIEENNDDVVVAFNDESNTRNESLEVVPYRNPQISQIQQDVDPINRPLVEINKDMNLMFLDLYNQQNEPLVRVNKKTVKSSTGKQTSYINILYTNRSITQKLTVFNCKLLYQFSLMTPFAMTRYPEPYPLGSYRNKWNDPHSECYDASKPEQKRPKLKDSKFGFELTNIPIEDSKSVNPLMDMFLNYCENLDQLIFRQVADQLEDLFPEIYLEMCKIVRTSGSEVSKLSIAVEFRKFWSGLVSTDKYGVRKLKVDLKVFKYASENEIEALKQPDFKCQSGNEEITKFLKRSLTLEDENGKKFGARWENSIPLYRCRSEKERNKLSGQKLNAFAATNYREAEELICKKSSVVSLIFSLKLVCDSSKVYLKPDVQSILWLKYGTQSAMATPNTVSFDDISFGDHDNSHYALQSASGEGPA